MKCPACHIDLNMTERQGIEIDYCPQCRGVWLDRGELDKMIERSTADRSTGTRTSAVSPLSSAGMMTRMSVTGTKDVGASRS